ncbi:hypothetical protein CVS47_02183 [Microbacterium lemovicicum]|uniref:Uncharacterized protein n=1 Tax=Microbacterium lemovicicum TaxID=1072463 RepID=A0A3Q9IZ53_9MICO|nr:hypothetical protein CVS47_02183 [Microbacterium lemovicicum]
MPLMSAARRRGGSTSQTATRILILLDVLGTPVAADCPVEDAVAVVSSLTRVQKLDFWLRNPDYLADELLTEFESGRASLGAVQPAVRRMLDGDAPSLHRYPMERYMYGAYEFIDDALSVLKMYGQIAHRRAADSGNLARRDYFLLTAGRDTVQKMRATIPELAWYDAQAAAIELIPDASLGATAKRRQYEQPEYEATAHGDVIPSILDRVTARATSLGVL